METGRPLRILHTNMLRGWGGQSNRILTEAVGVARAGHQVALAVPHGSVLQRKAEEAGLECFPGYQFKPPAQLWRFLPDLYRWTRDVRRWKPDLVHLHGSQDTWLAVTSRRFLGDAMPPTIRTKHNIFPWKTHGPNKWLYGSVDAYVSISIYIDRQIEAFPGLAKKPRALIRSVPDIPRFDESVQSIRSEFTHVPPGSFLWGVTSRLRREKALDVLLKAFALVRRQRQDAYLVIAGDGSERAQLEAQARLLNMGTEALAFLGFRKDVPAILASLDGYVLPSREEGLGTAILEALTVGLPVVSTNVGGIPDSVRHEQTGLLVEPENPEALASAMIRVMDDPDLRERFRENARRMIRDEFTESKLIADTISFYQSLARKP
jgi:glycosyltransferase involved in cell wall biosynthesis